MTDSEMLAQILLKLSAFERELRLLRVAVCKDADDDDSDGGVPEGFDEQEIGGYVISMTKKPGSNHKTNPVMYLYSQKMDLKTLTVYPSQSHLLPLFLQEKVDWRNGDYKRVIELEKPDVIASGDYRECPPFKVWRKHGDMLDNGKTKKDLEKVSWLSPEAQTLEDEITRKRMGIGNGNQAVLPIEPQPVQPQQSQAAQAKKVARFANPDAAIDWAASLSLAGIKKFESKDAAKGYYDIRKSEWKPADGYAMFEMWFTTVWSELFAKWAVGAKKFASEDAAIKFALELFSKQVPVDDKTATDMLRNAVMSLK